MARQSSPDPLVRQAAIKHGERRTRPRSRRLRSLPWRYGTCRAMARDAEVAVPASAGPRPGLTLWDPSHRRLSEVAAIVFPQPILTQAVFTRRGDQRIRRCAEAGDCCAGALRKARRYGAGTHITFGYARSQLDAAVLPSLDVFAAGLRERPDRKVLIEGHTDTDGRAANNRSLSLRRAEAVQKHLVVQQACDARPDGSGGLGRRVRCFRTSAKEQARQPSCRLVVSVSR